MSAISPSRQRGIQQLRSSLRHRVRARARARKSPATRGHAAQKPVLGNVPAGLRVLGGGRRLSGGG